MSSRTEIDVKRDRERERQREREEVCVHGRGVEGRKMNTGERKKKRGRSDEKR